MVTSGGNKEVPVVPEPPELLVSPLVELVLLAVVSPLVVFSVAVELELEVASAALPLVLPVSPVTAVLVDPLLALVAALPLLEVVLVPALASDVSCVAEPLVVAAVLVVGVPESDASEPVQPSVPRQAHDMPRANTNR